MGFKQRSDVVQVTSSHIINPIIFSLYVLIAITSCRPDVMDYTKDNVTFYLPRPFHFLSYQSNRLLRRSDLHSKNF
jgi:hypothetical protein